MRKDQDLATEAEKLDRAIVEAVSKEPSKRDSIAERRIRERLDEASKERNDLQQVFVRDFPNYTALSKPEPLATKEIQALLDNDEALVVIDLDKYSYVWVITRNQAEWKQLSVSADDVSKSVATLRAALIFRNSKAIRLHCCVAALPTGTRTARRNHFNEDPIVIRA